MTDLNQQVQQAIDEVSPCSFERSVRLDHNRSFGATFGDVFVLELLSGRESPGFVKDAVGNVKIVRSVAGRDQSHSAA